MADSVRKMSFQGKKGDTIHVPKPVRGTATAKAENTAVTLQNNVDTELQILIDQHFEYSRMIEDITEVQALASLRRFFTDDAGYALANQVDDSLFETAKSWGNGDGTDYTNSSVFYSNAGTSVAAYAVDTVASGDDFTDAVIRLMIQKLDENDVPMTNRTWVVPPISKQQILGIDRLNSSDFTDQMGVKTGMIGNAYGVDFRVSTNVPIIETAADNSAGEDVYGSALFHRDAAILVEQVGVRSQTQYKQEFLGTLYTSDMLYGVSEYRPEAGFTLAVHGA